MSRSAGARARLAGVLLCSSILAHYPLILSAQTAEAEEEARSTPAAGNAEHLGTILLTGEQLGFGVRGDAVFSTPGPVSATDDETIQTRFGGNGQSALRAVPGVFTRQQSNQPGIEVNIRGMNGYGRVNAMIDGVPQTFKNTGGHEASGGALLYVHPELIGGIEVVRGAVSGAHGAGTLTGAANFSTLSIGDVLPEGKDRGVMTRLKFGDNGYRKSGMIAYGQRIGGLFGGDGSISFLGALAYTDQGDYKDGNGTIAAGKGSSNSPKGGLVKVEVAPNASNRLHLGTRWYDNGFVNSGYNWAIDNQTTTAGWDWSPGSDWINLDLDLYHNNTELAYLGSGGSFAGRRTEDVSYGLSLTNRAAVALNGGVNLDLEYGLSWGRNDFRTHERRGGNHPGELDKASLFVDASFDFGRFSLINGIRYDYWRIHGWRAPYAGGVGDCPAGGPACGDEWVSRDGGELLPKLGVTWDVTDELELYATYSHTFRPPSSHETFFALVPLGTGVGSGVANNLDLEPEKSKGIDIGLNFRRDGLFLADDKARLKIGYFQNRIENFIVNDFVDVPGRGSTAMWVNRPGTTKMQGIELEASYDAGFVFAGLSYADTDTADQPYGDGAGAGNGEGAVQPERVATLDIGTRLLDEKLTLGAQFRYVGKGKEVQFGTGWVDTPSYSLIDLYASYDIGENAQFFLSVENVEDKAYGYAGSGLNNYRAQTGRGRTVILGLTTRF